MLVVDVGITQSKITGVIDQKVYSLIYHELSFKNENYIHQKKYSQFAQERHYLITPSTKVFQTGLLPRVCQLLEKHGLEYSINDHREESPPEFFMPMNGEKPLRPYQIEAVRSAVENKCGILRMATGAGKTRVASEIVSQLERRTVILVHRIDLLKQFAEVLKSLLHFPDIVGIIGGGIFEPNIITICTMQTVTYALDIQNEENKDEKYEDIFKYKKQQIIELLESANVVIVDEVHHIVAETFAQVMKRCKNATYRLGFSATDWRDDGADLLIEAAVGPRIYDISISSLVDMDYLVPAYVTVYPQAEPKEKCSSKESWQTLNSTYYTRNNNFHQQVLDINRVWFDEGRTILTLITQIKHGVALEKLHNSSGIKTIFLSGSDSSDYREKIFNEVRSGKLRHLIGTSIADEGLDLPQVDALNMAGGGKSSVKVYQRIGRTLRPSEGKTHALVADYKPAVDLLAYHCKKRISIYKFEKEFHLKEIK